MYGFISTVNVFDLLAGFFLFQTPPIIRIRPVNLALSGWSVRQFVLKERPRPVYRMTVTSPRMVRLTPS